MNSTIADRQPLSVRRAGATARLVGPAAVQFISNTFRLTAGVQLGYVILWIYHSNIACNWRVMMYGNQWTPLGEINTSDGFHFLYEYIPAAIVLFALWGLLPLAREYMLRRYLRVAMYNARMYRSIRTIDAIGVLFLTALWVAVTNELFDGIPIAHVLLQLLVVFVWGLYTTGSSLFMRGQL